MEREAAIAAAVDAIRQRWGAHSLTRGPLVGHQPGRGPSAARDDRRRPPWWPGAPGYARPNVLELAGPPSCGKLSLALLWLAALPTGGTVAVVAEAGSFYPPRELARAGLRPGVALREAKSLPGEDGRAADPERQLAAQRALARLPARWGDAAVRPEPRVSYRGTVPRGPAARPRVVP